MIARLPPVRATQLPREPLVQALKMLTPSLSRAAHGGLPPNRRGEIRRSLRLGCRVRRADTMRLVGDRAVDLSPQGMLLLSDELLGLGTPLEVSFMATDLPIWFDTRATIARVIEGRRPGDSGRAIGLRFDSLAAVSRLILRGHLRKIPPTLPRRAPPIDLRPKRRDPDYGRIVKDIFDGR